MHLEGKFPRKPPEAALGFTVLVAGGRFPLCSVQMMTAQMDFWGGREVTSLAGWSKGSGCKRDIFHPVPRLAGMGRAHKRRRRDECLHLCR